MRLAGLRRSAWPLALLAFLLSANTLANDFVNYDDDVLVLENPDVRSRSLEGAAGLLTPERGREYLPVRDLSYWLDTLVFGTNAWGYHLSQALLHALVTALLFVFLRDVLLRDVLLTARGASGSFILYAAVLLFAVHPVHAEAVAWISGRKDLLAALWIFAALLGHAAWRGKGRRSGYALSIGATLLALLSKATSVVLPLLLWLGDRLQWKTPPRRSLALLPHLVLAVAAGILALAAGRQAGMLQGPHGGDLPSHLAIVCRVFIHSLANLLLPRHLQPDYGLQTTGVLESPWSLAAVALSVGLLLLLVRWGRRDRTALWAGAFFLITYLPTSNLIPFQELGADRYLYLPSAGFFLLVALGSEALWRRLLRGRAPTWARYGIALAAALYLVYLGASLVVTNTRWKNGETLWTYVLEGNAGSATGHYNLGWTHLKEERYEQALPHLAEAVRLEPDHVMARVNYGYALTKAGRPEEAVAVLEEAVRRFPGHLSAYYNLACAHARLGHAREAVRWLERAESMGFELRELVARDEDLDPIRDSAEFRSFVARIRP